MPDILGYWDRRTDDEDYIGDDAIGNAIYKSKKHKVEISSSENAQLKNLIKKLGKKELIRIITCEYQ